LLQRIFQDAKKVPERALPKKDVPLTEEEYQRYLKGARSLLERVGSAIGSDWEVQAQLLELVEHLKELENRIQQAGYPSTIRDEKMRYKALGDIGDALIDLIEVCPKLED
jgi:ribonuclease D